jgi:hypothetical protein
LLPAVIVDSNEIPSHFLQPVRVVANDLDFKGMRFFEFLFPANDVFAKI